MNAPMDNIKHSFIAKCCFIYKCNQNAIKYVVESQTKKYMPNHDIYVLLEERTEYQMLIPKQKVDNFVRCFKKQDNRPVSNLFLIFLFFFF